LHSDRIGPGVQYQLKEIVSYEIINHNSRK
jgi:hypothetical protein